MVQVSMSIPALRAAELCRAEGGDFLDELRAHLVRGWVFSTADTFLMGRAVPRGADLSDPWHDWGDTPCDAWFVWWGVGDAARLLALMPYPLEWIGWVRCGRGWPEVHWVRTAALRRRLSGSSQHLH